jgi:hypothetical protein
MKKAQNALNDAGGDKILLRMDAIITSMTVKERAKPELVNAKRKIRIAKGSGTTVQDVNKLLKMHQEMSTAMKKIKKMGGIKGMMSMLGKGGLGGLGNALGGPQMGEMLNKAGSNGLPGGGLGGMGGGKLPDGIAGNLNFLLQGLKYGSQHSSVAWWLEEAPLLPHRGGRRPCAARRQVHREDRQLQPAPRQGQ